MQRILIDNYLIETPISKIIELLRISLTNGKLKDVQDKEFSSIKVSFID